MILGSRAVGQVGKWGSGGKVGEMGSGARHSASREPWMLEQSGRHRGFLVERLKFGQDSRYAHNLMDAKFFGGAGKTL